MEFPRFKCTVTGPDYGFVYLMTYPGSTKVKIGHSLDPITRATQIGGTLAPENPVPAAYYWCSERRHDVEKKAHELANSYRRNGEWFELATDEAMKIVIEAAKQCDIEIESVYKRKTGRFATKEQRQAYIEERNKKQKK